MSDKIKKTNRSNKGMRPLAYSLKPITQKAFGKKSALFGQLILDWQTVTKGMDCQDVTPIKLAFPHGKNNGATLSLAASSAQAFTLGHSTIQILERINQFFGYKAVDKITFIHQTLKPSNAQKTVSLKTVSPEKIKKLQNDLDFIDDGEMKKALVALGKSVIHKGLSDSLQDKKG